MKQPEWSPELIERCCLAVVAYELKEKGVPLAVISEVVTQHKDVAVATWGGVVKAVLDASEEFSELPNGETLSERRINSAQPVYQVTRRACGHPLGETRWCPDCALEEEKALR